MSAVGGQRCFTISYRIWMGWEAVIDSKKCYKNKTDIQYSISTSQLPGWGFR